MGAVWVGVGVTVVVVGVGVTVVAVGVGVTVVAVGAGAMVVAVGVGVTVAVGFGVAVAVGVGVGRGYHRERASAGAENRTPVATLAARTEAPSATPARRRDVVGVDRWRGDVECLLMMKVSALHARHFPAVTRSDEGAVRHLRIASSCPRQNAEMYAVAASGMRVLG